TVDTAVELCREVRKIPVRVKECPGFLVNRLLFPYMNEALWVLQEGIATPEQVDKAVVDFGMPMGPFTLFDMTGIDICAHVEDFLYSEYGPRFEPAPLLNLLVKAGHLGQKSGAGFYAHEKGQQPKKDEPKKLNPDLEKLLAEARKIAKNQGKASKPFDAFRVILPMFNEATYAIQEEVAQPGDVDV